MNLRPVYGLAASLLICNSALAQGAVKKPAVHAPVAAAGKDVKGGDSRSKLIQAGDLARVQGKDAAAQASYHSAMEQSEKNKDDKSLIAAMAAIADCMVADRTQLGDEEALRQKTAALAEKAYGAGSPQYALRLAQWADAAARRGDIAGAEASTDKAMNILGSDDQKYPQEMAACYEATAARQISLGTMGLAVGSYAKAYELLSAKFPTDNLHVLDCCRRYADVLKLLDRKDEAAALEKQIASARNVTVSAAPLVSTKPVKANDAKALFDKLVGDAKAALRAEDKEKSLTCWKLVVEQAEKMGTTDGRLAYALVHLGDCNHALGKNEEAARLYRKAMDIRGENKAGLTLGMVRNVSRLAAVEMSSKNVAEADKLYTQALDIEDQVSAPDTVKAITLQNLMSSGMMAQNNNKVEQSARRLIEIAGKQDGPLGTMQKSMATAMLGAVYMKSGRLNEGMALMKNMGQMQRPDPQQSTDAMKQSYLAQEAIFDKSEEEAFIN